MASHTRNRLDRFWSKVAVIDGDGCWEWQAGVVNKEQPYGDYSLGVGRRERAHRFSWQVTNGPIPEGLVVCHRCDNPKCVRPDHLFLGTIGDNNRDMYAKGRNGNSPPPRAWRSGLCRNGLHDITDPSNVRDKGQRRCRACARAGQEAFRKTHGRSAECSRRAARQRAAAAST